MRSPGGLPCTRRPLSHRHAHAHARGAYPALQAQSEAEEDAEGESELDGQLLQEVSETLYLPAVQALQVTPPASLLPV